MNDKDSEETTAMPHSTTPPPQPERHAVASVASDMLDCIQANLAILADHHHGGGTHLRLGTRLGFAWWDGPDGLPTVDAPLDQHLAEAETFLGLAVRDRARMDAHTLIESLHPGDTRYVVADTYQMPWLPYYQRAHMPHSFLLAAGHDGWHITDAYHNATQWGTASPGHWVLPEHDLAALGPAEVIDLQPTPIGQRQPAGYQQANAPDEYLAAFEACSDRTLALQRLTAETWLLARARKLHARFRAQAGTPIDSEHLRRWDAVVEQTYLAYRRVARGHGEPPATLTRLADALAADTHAFSAATSVTSGTEAPNPAVEPPHRRSIASLVASVLGVAEEDLLNGADFTTLAAFSSFRLVEIIERLESELGLEIDADALVPENLHRVDDLCRIAR